MTWCALLNPMAQVLRIPLEALEYRELKAPARRFEPKIWRPTLDIR